MDVQSIKKFADLLVSCNYDFEYLSAFSDFPASISKELGITSPYFISNILAKDLGIIVLNANLAKGIQYNQLKQGIYNSGTKSLHVTSFSFGLYEDQLKSYVISYNSPEWGLFTDKLRVL